MRALTLAAAVMTKDAYTVDCKKCRHLRSQLLSASRVTGIGHHGTNDLCNSRHTVGDSERSMVVELLACTDVDNKLTGLHCNQTTTPQYCNPGPPLKALKSIPSSSFARHTQQSQEHMLPGSTQCRTGRLAHVCCTRKYWSQFGRLPNNLIHTAKCADSTPQLPWYERHPCLTLSPSVSRLCAGLPMAAMRCS